MQGSSQSPYLIIFPYFPIQYPHLVTCSVLLLATQPSWLLDPAVRGRGPRRGEQNNIRSQPKPPRHRPRPSPSCITSIPPQCPHHCVPARCEEGQRMVRQAFYALQPSAGHRIPLAINPNPRQDSWNPTSTATSSVAATESLRHTV